MKAIAEEPIKMNVYEISYADDPNYRVNRTAATAGKAKYNEYLNYSDYCCDTTYMDFLKLIRCRKVGQSTPKKGELLPPGMPWLEERIEKANRLIREIGSRSHRDLYSPKHDRYIAFHWAGGRLWLTDHYTGIPMIMEPKACGKTRDQKRAFSSGGTMWGLVNDFKDFIYGDDEANHNNGYGGLYCRHWGYPEEDMEAIRQLARELGYLPSIKGERAV
ncbi:hypothetical protein [Paenibacillus pinihumi]|uniref:hypothetical protein n=1 Tax=Paenibacillus pinihumi TaxID=669462 RepID=UPI00041840F3|nr:hypothetical protein [Paenibacillus pinihumi]